MCGNEDFWNLVVGETNRKSDQFFATHKNFSKRSIFSILVQDQLPGDEEIYRSDISSRLRKKTSLAPVLVKGPTNLYMDRDWYELLIQFFSLQ